jgi:hypothetical protein
MYQIIPEGYYSLDKIFHFLGNDMYEHDWEEISKVCSHYNVFHNSSMACEDHIMSKLEPFNFSLSHTHLYKRYTFFNVADSVCCELLAQNMMQNEPRWKLKDFIGDQTLEIATLERVNSNSFLYELFDNDRRARKDVWKISQRQKIQPLGILGLQQFMEYVFKYFLVKKRLSYMFSFSVLTAFMLDKKTNHLEELSFTCWRKRDSLPKEEKPFRYDFSTGQAFYRHFSEITGAIENYKGCLLVKKEDFDTFKNSDLTQFSNHELIQMILELGRQKSAPLLKREEEKFDSEAQEDWEDEENLPYTTPELEALKRVLNNYPKFP